MQPGDVCKSCQQLFTASLTQVSIEGADPDISKTKIFLPVKDVESTRSEAEAAFLLKRPMHQTLHNFDPIITLISGLDAVRPFLFKSLREIRKSVERKDCHLCSMLHEDIEQYEAHHVQTGPRLAEDSPVVVFILIQTPKWSYLTDTHHHHHVQIRYCIATADVAADPPNRPMVVFGLLAHKKDDSNYRADSSNLQFHGLHTKILDRLREWLQQCNKWHDLCRDHNEHAGKPIRPRRLLRIEKLETDWLVKLVEPQSPSSSLKYISLSHCWGSRGPTTKLSKASYTSWHSRVPFERLSKTFRDAVVITSLLGFDHLWIDALCIIQDDDDDWQQEAPKMKSVFAGSVVTLAATSSVDGDGGLLCQTDFPSGCTTDFLFKGQPELRGKYEVTAELNNALSASLFSHHVQSSHLHSRAWVHQEMVLSPRIIHFTNREIWWECQSGAQKETWTHEHFLLPSRFGAASYPLRDICHDYKDGHWRNAVESYSGKKLSFLSDKLVAFAGIAQAFGSLHQLSPSSYLAGLWRADLPNSLFWYRVPLSPSDDGEQQISTECAPSWSWASYSGPVKFYSPCFPHIDTYKIIEATVLTHTPDPFSTVVQGKLVLQARVFEIESIDQAALVLRTLNDGTIHLSWAGQHGWVWGLYEQKYVVASTHAVLVEEVPGLVFLLVRLVESDGERGVYTRVDFARASKSAGPWLDGWDQRGSELEEEKYIRVCNPGEYEIALV